MLIPFLRIEPAVDCADALQSWDRERSKKHKMFARPFVAFEIPVELREHAGSVNVVIVVRLHRNVRTRRFLHVEWPLVRHPDERFGDAIELPDNYLEAK